MLYIFDVKIRKLVRMFGLIEAKQVTVLKAFKAMVNPG
ncbi:hypothetical protein B6N60_00610 [Richelia sinica FACHB-800]|uniref:Uncharacterized protein n=1 Tax=Richelia sinica FACHB-800 TaxID=1357546 RepID=A0A975T5N7_9NOST|nr:hypothetical protein B6N60_00610 [Richelia sinica FACHB-800]